MAEHLQPGGVGIKKLAKNKKQEFLVQVKNLSKPIIAQELKNGLSSTDSSVIMVSSFK